MNKHMSPRLAILATTILAMACTDLPLAPGPSDLASSSETAQLRENQRESRRLDSLLVEARAASDVPGMVAALVSGKGIVARGAIGVRRVGFVDAIKIGDRFHLGSNVKAMTSTMIATLVEQGKLSWSSTLAGVFPELASSMNGQMQSVTLEQLLIHRSGIAAFTDVAEYLALPPFDGTATQQRYAFARWLLQRPPAVPRGSYLYSNAGYAIAGAMAERVAGRPFERLMRDRLFEPLEMRATQGWPAQVGDSEPWGYVDLGSAYEEIDPFGEFQLPPLLAPAGDINMSIADYANFVRLHLRSLEGKPELLKAESFQRLHTPNESYAMGWSVVALGENVIMAHYGSAGTFAAMVVIAPALDRAAIVLANAGGARPEFITEQTAFKLLGLIP